MIGQLRRNGLRLFGRLPKPVRRFIVRRVAPSWTAGAVAIVERDDGRWLMVKPVYRPGWSLPGGLLDRGETPEQAVVREFSEELGLAIVVESQPWVVYDSAMRRVDAIFRASVGAEVDLDAIEVRTPELDGVAWFDPDDLPIVEQEAVDVVSVLRQSGEGGPRILMR